MERAAGIPFLKPWFWLGVTSCLTVLGPLIYWYGRLRRDGLRPLLVLVASAGLFYPQLLLTGLDNDLRFSYWAMISGALSLYLFLTAVLGPAPKGTTQSLGSEGASGKRTSSMPAGTA